MDSPQQPQYQCVSYNQTSISNLPIGSFDTPDRGTVQWRTLFSQPDTPTNNISAGIAVCPPRTGSLALHRHAQAEVYYITEGKGTVTVDGEDHDVEAGSVLFIPGNAEHGVKNRNEEPLKWFYVFPTGNFGDVIYRFSHEEDASKGNTASSKSSRIEIQAGDA